MKFLIVLCLVLVLVAGGCSKGGGPSVSITEEDIHRGKEGLLIEFGKNMPPSLVYEEDMFPIGIELENAGASDITKGYLLLNLEEDNMDLEKGHIKETFKIEGKSIENPYGDSEVLNYMVRAKPLGSETETITSNVIATLCYKYNTRFGESVCVDTDFYNRKNAVKACGAEDESFSSGQGAPVSVVKVESKMLEESGDVKPMFIVHVRNDGDGQVINPTIISEVCSSRVVKHEDINYIEVSAYLGEEELVCRPSPLKLREKEDIVRCSLEQGIDKDVPSYKSLLTVDLEYGYSETISKQVEIRSLG